MTADTRAALAETLTAIQKANEAIVRLTAAIAQEEPPKPYTTPDVSTLNASTPDTARYFSVKEAAKYTTLSTVTIRRAAKERRLAYCHNGGRIIFSKEQLDDFLLHATVSSDRQLSERADALLNSANRKRNRRF